MLESSRTPVRLYRRYASLSVRTRWAVGFAGPIVLTALFGAAGLLAAVLAVSVVTDLKLLAVLGAVIGPYHGVEVLVAGYLLAAVMTLGIVSVRLARRASSRVASGRACPGRMGLLTGTLPMAPFFAAGVAFTLAY